ncbi:hypothetical protein SAMN04488109_6823 [Chryseolinea serpens]|uniref:Uncharacterized protein n=1 Tax=Chryseolinea serpens TaxID=947013 RepID=A0A1M5XTB7_9BACT|nr:hypothetical protein SAMN04488109_6823 [Chryseolinea serpens]
MAALMGWKPMVASVSISAATTAIKAWVGVDNFFLVTIPSLRVDHSFS